MYTIVYHSVNIGVATCVHGCPFITREGQRVRDDTMRCTSMLPEMIAGGEGKTVEFKQDVPKDVMKYVPTAVAFANTTGGTMVFGVSDTGEIVGIEEGLVKSRMEEVSCEIGGRTEPTVSFEVDSYCLEGRHLIVVEVHRGSLTPYRMKGRGVFIRQGRNTFQACEEKIRELELERVNRTFDSLPFLDGSGSRDVAGSDVEGLLSLMREHGHEGCTVETLVSMGVLDLVDGRLASTVAFDLLTANRGRYETSCALFRGLSKIDFEDRTECSGNIMEQIETAVSFVRRNMRRRAVIKGLYREDVYDVPITALREAIVNALVHRSYVNRDTVTVTILDDRIEVESPGTLLMRAEQLGTGMYRTRNEVVARFLREVGVCETRGTGVQRMREACRAQGLREPLIEEVEDHVRVTFFKESGQDRIPALGMQERRMLEIMSRDPDVTQDRMAEELGISKAYVAKLVRHSKDRGLLVRDATVRKGGWAVDLERLERM